MGDQLTARRHVRREHSSYPLTVSSEERVCAPADPFLLHCHALSVSRVPCDGAVNRAFLVSVQIASGLLGARSLPLLSTAMKEVGRGWCEAPDQQHPPAHRVRWLCRTPLCQGRTVPFRWTWPQAWCMGAHPWVGGHALARQDAAPHPMGSGRASHHRAWSKALLGSWVVVVGH